MIKHYNPPDPTGKVLWMRTWEENMVNNLQSGGVTLVSVSLMTGFSTFDIVYRLNPLVLSFFEAFYNCSNNTHTWGNVHLNQCYISFTLCLLEHFRQEHGNRFCDRWADGTNRTEVWKAVSIYLNWNQFFFDHVFQDCWRFGFGFNVSSCYHERFTLNMNGDHLWRILKLKCEA